MGSLSYRLPISPNGRASAGAARLEPRRVLGVVLLEPQPRRGRRLSEVRRGVRIRAGGLQRPRAAGVVGQPLERDHGDPAVGETRRHELKNGLQLAW